MVAHYAMPFRLFLAVCRIPIVVFGWPSGMMGGLAIAHLGGCLQVRLTMTRAGTCSSPPTS